MTNFDLQGMLQDMEGRIRADIAEVKEATKEAAITANTANLDTVRLSGRVTNLEEKAAWIGAGIGTLFFSAIGFVWHVLSTGHKP